VVVKAAGPSPRPTVRTPGWSGLSSRRFDDPLDPEPSALGARRWCRVETTGDHVDGGHR
jgi:hypothetical protein